MYCKHDTQADIESKRRIISEKIEMKRNSANMKRSSSIMPNAKLENALKSGLEEKQGDQKQEKYALNSISEENGQKAIRPKGFKDMKPKANVVDPK